MIIFFAIIVSSISLYFFILFFLKKRNIGSTRNRKFIALAPTIIMLPVIFLSFIFISFAAMSYYPREKFDQIKWQENIEERYRMSNYIIENDILIGKTREQIIELLGNDFYEWGNSIGYNLGIVPGIIGMSPDILVVYFENNLVIQVKQIRT